MEGVRVGVVKAVCIWCLGSLSLFATGMQEIDKGVERLADKIVFQMQKYHIGRIAVGDISSNGVKSMFEQYIEEEIVNAIISKDLKGITIVERRRLYEVLKEQKLGTTGLLDEKTRIALGKILGVEAIISGTTKVTSKEAKVNARMYAVSTGKILAAPSFVFLRNETVDELMAEPLMKHRDTDIYGKPSTHPPKRYQNRAQQKIESMLITVPKIFVDSQKIIITLKVRNMDRKHSVALSVFAKGSDNIADFWKFFPRPKQCVLSDENGNSYKYLSTTLPFAKTSDDWLVVKANSQEVIQFTFKNRSNLQRGKYFTFSALIRTGTVGADNRVDIKKHTVYLENLVSN
jgi:hypothetical protein